MKRVAFFVYGLSDLSGGGGYERFFSDFFSDYNESSDKKYNLYFITDSLVELNKVGKLFSNKQNVLFFTDYRFKLYYDLTDKIPLLNNIFKRFRNLYTQIAFFRLLKKNKIDILHLPNYLNKYYFLLRFLNRIQFFSKIKLAITIVDCRIPFEYNSSDSYYINSGATKQTFERLFKNIQLNGIFTWYKSFREFVQREKLVKDKTKIYCIHSRYVKVATKAISFSQKENSIILACRLDDQKRPFHYVYAIQQIKTKHPDLIKGWKFKIFGKGILEEELNNFIIQNDLEDVLTLSFSSEMVNELEKSKCFISTQCYENFPSLAIYEALSTGNAIIAYNVGQTDSFIKHNYNGLLVENETPESLAGAIISFITDTNKHEFYFKNNIKMSTEEHNFLNFKLQIEEFWNSLN